MYSWFHFSHWSLRSRILVACALGLVLSASMGIVCLVRMNKITQLTKSVSEIWVPQIQRVSEVRQKTQSFRSAEWEILSESNLDARSELSDEFDSLAAGLTIYNRTLESGIPDEQSLEAFKQYKAQWENYLEVHEKFLELVLKGRSAEARLVLAGKANGIFEQMQANAQEMDNIAYNGSITARDTANEEAARIRQQVMVAIPTVFLIALGFVSLIMLRLSRQLAALSDRIRNSAALVMEKGESLSTMAVELSQSTTEEAASLEETSKSVRSIEDKANKSAQTARTTASAIQNTRDRASMGIQHITKLREAMDGIGRSNGDILSHVEESHREMEEINRIIQSVSEKTKIINEIVFQTKLLSFNASVEAARAGEHGRGFSVVAEEMAKLAKLSGVAAMDIGVILESSSSKVHEIVDKAKKRVGEAVKASGASIRIGADLTQGCSSALQEIVQAAEAASKGASEISQSATQQAQAMGQITTAVQHISTATQQNSSLSSGTANESVELRKQSAMLTEIVGMLDTSVYGEAHGKKARKSEAA